MNICIVLYCHEGERATFRQPYWPHANPQFISESNQMCDTMDLILQLLNTAKVNFLHCDSTTMKMFICL